MRLFRYSMFDSTASSPENSFPSFNSSEVFESSNSLRDSSVEYTDFLLPICVVILVSILSSFPQALLLGCINCRNSLSFRSSTRINRVQCWLCEAAEAAKANGSMLSCGWNKPSSERRGSFSLLGLFSLPWPNFGGCTVPWTLLWAKLPTHRNYSLPTSSAWKAKTNVNTCNRSESIALIQEKKDSATLCRAINFVPWECLLQGRTDLQSLILLANWKCREWVKMIERADSSLQN